MQKIKLRTEESGKKLSAAYAPPKWSETAEEKEDLQAFLIRGQIWIHLFNVFYKKWKRDYTKKLYETAFWLYKHFII